MRWTARWALAHRAPIVESIDKEHAMNDSFKGLRVTITGGTSGLGLALVQAPQRRGAQVPLQPLADTECEDFEAALATNVLGPFRLTKALLGALSASARE